MSLKTNTNGNIIVEDIKIGDIHYEYYGPYGSKVKVLTLPKMDSDGNWTWESENLLSGKLINYFVQPNYTEYGPKLYDYEAHSVSKFI